jgi:hypothetical protein
MMMESLSSSSPLHRIARECTYQSNLPGDICPETSFIQRQHLNINHVSSFSTMAGAGGQSDQSQGSFYTRIQSL